MPPLSGFEARLVGALALFGSTLLHGGVLLFAAPLEAPRQDVRIEVVSFADDDSLGDRVEKGNAAPSLEPSEDDAELPSLDDTPSGAEDAVDDDETARAAIADESTLPWRERLRLREREHQRHLETKARRVAALARHDARAPAGGAHLDDVSLCGARDPGRRVTLGQERDVRAYASVLPGGLFPSAYLEDMRELRSTKRPVAREGHYLFALPAAVLPIALDAPKGALVAIGRADARCLVGVGFTPKTFFPLRFTGVPVRIVDENDRVSAALVDVALFDDATFALTVREGGPLPFTSGALYDREAVARNLRQHYVGARVLRDLAGLLGSE